MAVFLQQYRRVLRFPRRIRDFDGYKNTTDYTDDLRSFFQNAWHPKDWIKNDESLSPDVVARILAQVESDTGTFRICAQLAN